MSYPSDEAVMKSIQEGKFNFLGVLFARYSKRAHALCYRMVGDAQLCDDLVQEAFLRVLRYRGSFRDGTRFSPWLFRIVRNVCLDQLKDDNRREIGTRRLAAETEDFEPCREADESQIVTIRLALARLSPEKRQLLTMSRIEGFSYEAIAEHLNISTGAARVRVHRAVRELKSIVDGLQDGES